MPTIGVMSSIPYKGTSFQTALETNVNVSGVSFYPNPEDDAPDLVKAVKNLLAANVNYIVTLGGYAAYDAAANNSTVPLFSLAGEIPNPVAANCWGGKSLESWGYNEERVKYLINTKNFNKEGAISLYYNQNSSIASDELGNWTNTLYPKYKNSNSEYILVKTPIPAMKKKGTNDEKDFDTTVDNIQSSAAIVSADPFFHKKHDALVGKFNKTKLFVCYPLQNYGDANPKLNTGSAILYGPKLEDAITALAGVINSALTACKAEDFSKQPLGDPTDPPKSLLQVWQIFLSAIRKLTGS